MICAVHALVGASIGHYVKGRRRSFAAGVATHLLCDLIPHKDFAPHVEAPLLAVTLAALAAKHGINSPEMWGAIGAVSPDFENAAQVVKLIPPEAMLFPTHQGPQSHGREVGSALPQGVLALVCAAYVFGR
jgi:hypothetical protein